MYQGAWWKGILALPQSGWLQSGWLVVFNPKVEGFVPVEGFVLLGSFNPKVEGFENRGTNLQSPRIEETRSTQAALEGYLAHKKHTLPRTLQ